MWPTVRRTGHQHHPHWTSGLVCTTAALQGKWLLTFEKELSVSKLWQKSDFPCWILYNTVEQDTAKELTKALTPSKVPSESDVKSWGAGKALSLRGWKPKEGKTELKSILIRLCLYVQWFSELLKVDWLIHRVFGCIYGLRTFKMTNYKLIFTDSGQFLNWQPLDISKVIKIFSIFFILKSQHEDSPEPNKMQLNCSNRLKWWDSHVNKKENSTQ